MSLTEEFSKILGKDEEIDCARIFILKNDKPKKMKIFPEEVSSVIINEYFKNLKMQTKDKEFVAYIPDLIEKSTLQVISTEKIDIWNNIFQARSELSIVNMKKITVDDYNTDGNTILIEIEYVDKEKIYFLTTYKKVVSHYQNKVLFCKQNGKFVQQKGTILALTPYVDVVIKNNKCYIIDEANFNKIFKYDEVINKQIEKRKEEIKELSFIGDADTFVTMLNASPRAKQSMSKILTQNRIEKINSYERNYIRKQIEEQSELDFIKFNDNDTIIVNKKSFKAIIDILRGKINLDLITKKLNGVEDNE